MDDRVVTLRRRRAAKPAPALSAAQRRSLHARVVAHLGDAPQVNALPLSARRDAADHTARLVEALAREGLKRGVTKNKGGFASFASGLVEGVCSLLIALSEARNCTYAELVTELRSSKAGINRIVVTDGKIGG